MLHIVLRYLVMWKTEEVKEHFRWLAKCVSYWLCISNQSVITISMTQIVHFYNICYWNSIFSMHNLFANSLNCNNYYEQSFVTTTLKSGLLYLN